MKRFCCVALGLAASTFGATALADNSHDVVHDAEVNGAGGNTGVGDDPIHDAEVGKKTNGGASPGAKKRSGNVSVSTSTSGSTGSSSGSTSSSSTTTSNTSSSNSSGDAIHDAEVGGSSSSAKKTDDEDEGGDPVEHHYAVEANPLAIIIGRYSFQFEWLPISHHALVVNPHFDYAGISVNGESVGHVIGGGAEIGYRFYTSRHNLAGFYAGPSLLFGTYSSGGGDSESVSFQSIGLAVDIGGQAVIGPGIVIGGGFGLQYSKTTKDFGSTDGLNLASEILVGSGFRPRFLFTIGYAF